LMAPFCADVVEMVGVGDRVVVPVPMLETVDPPPHPQNKAPEIATAANRAMLPGISFATVALIRSLPECAPAWRVRTHHRLKYSASTTKPGGCRALSCAKAALRASRRNRKHTSELQSLRHLVCRLLLE